MGKHKLHSWMPSKKREQTGARDLAMANALYLANYQLKKEEESRRILATDKVAVEQAEELINRYTDWDLGCAVIVAHRMFGIEGTDAVEFLDEIQRLTRSFIEDGISYKGVWDRVEEECGITIEREY